MKTKTINVESNKSRRLEITLLNTQQINENKKKKKKKKRNQQKIHD